MVPKRRRSPEFKVSDAVAGIKDARLLAVGARYKKVGVVASMGGTGDSAGSKV